MMKIHGTSEGEAAVLVSDKWQGRGLGKELLARLLVVGADEKLTKLTADILPDNRDVMRICEKLGFTLKHLARRRSGASRVHAVERVDNRREYCATEGQWPSVALLLGDCVRKTVAHGMTFPPSGRISSSGGRPKATVRA